MNVSGISQNSILETCKIIVKERGFSAISIRCVATKCNVSIGSIYNYFPSKSQLIFSIIESIWQDIFKLSKEEKVFDDFQECLIWLFESIKNGSKEYPTFFSIHSLDFDASDKKSGRTVMENYFGELKKILLSSLTLDKKIRQDAFNEVLTPNLFVNYIFANLISTLSSRQSNCNGLLLIVQRCLY